MAKKRKRDPRADSNSPDARDTSRPSDCMSVLQQMLDVLGSIHHELRGIAQVNSTVEVLADKISKLDGKVENILNKSKENIKEEIKEVVKLEMQGNIGKSDGVQPDNKQNQAKVPDCSDASPSLRSQPHQSEPPRFRLKIKSTMRSVSYKGRHVQTNVEGDGIEVEMLDDEKPIAHDHPLASVKVNLVLVDAELFHGISKKHWSLEEFRETLWNQKNAKLLKKGSFSLKGGRAIQREVIITQGTVRKDVRLAVMVEELGSERVLEGLSNPFKVQEAKTANHEKRKESGTNGTGKMCNPPGQAPCWNDQQCIPRKILSQPMQHDCREREGSATHHTTKVLPRHTGENLQQPICKTEDPHQERLPHFYDAQSSHPQVNNQSSSHLASTPAEENGHGRNRMMTQRFASPTCSQTSQYVAGNDLTSRPQQQYTNPRDTSQQHHRGQGQVISSQYHNFPPNSLPAINPQIVAGQGQLNSHHHHNQQKSLFPATHAQPMAGQGQLNSSQHHNLPLNTFSAMGQAENGQEQFQHGQPQIFPVTGKEQVISGQGQVVSGPHHILPTSSLTALNASSAGQEDNFQQAHRQILQQHTRIEVVKHGGQGQLNSQMLLPAVPPQNLDVLMRVNSSQNTPYYLDASASQVNPPTEPINNSSCPIEENYGSMWSEEPVYTPMNQFCEGNENLELFLAEL